MRPAVALPACYKAPFLLERGPIPTVILQHLAGQGRSGARLPRGQGRPREWGHGEDLGQVQGV